MADNRFNNSKDEFEDIYSNSSGNDKYKDIYSNSNDADEFKKMMSSYEGDIEQDTDITSHHNHNVKYNSAVQNRRRQEIKYDDIDSVYGDLSSDDTDRKKKKKHPVRNTIIAILCITLVGLSCFGIWGYRKADDFFSLFNTEEQLSENMYMDAADLTQYPDQINVLLIGVDAREGETDSRSDTMMLVTLDNANKEIKLTSFLRDSYVEIAGRNSWSKLNSAYFRGGIQMLSDTLELNFKVDIQYYALVDFEIFITIVDELGGINVDVTEKESYYTYHSGDVNVPVRIPAGEDVHLDRKSVV